MSTKEQLIEQLAEHRTDNATDKDLRYACYDDTIGYLDGYTVEELTDMVAQEIN